MRTRSGGVNDLPSLMALEEGAFGPKRFSEAFVLDLLHDPLVTTLIVEAEGAVVAYAMIRSSPAYHTVEVLSLAVSPLHRRRGLGRGLIQEVERSIADSGTETVMLCVRPENQAAVDLYLSEGYKVLARCRNYYGKGSDANMMVKHLEE
ncbi:MAG TPA: GNAT family N-acetyltransferase [Methanomassiliicoccales archaeon]|nr:GNAT family N-acetyltransferase [Methanomassiliicoccales archaeon]